MKQLKLIITLLIATAFIYSCNPKEKTPTTTKVEKTDMSFSQLSKELGEKYAFQIFDSAGKTEADPAARGQKRPKNNAVVTVWLYDLTLSLTGTTLTSTVSANAKWAAFQHFVNMTTNDGASTAAVCNFYYYAPNMSPQPETCQTWAIGGFYRFFSYDHDGQVHISNVVQVTN